MVQAHSGGTHLSTELVARNTNDLKSLVLVPLMKSIQFSIPK